MGQITTTQNRVAIKEVRHAGQQNRERDLRVPDYLVQQHLLLSRTARQQQHPNNQETQTKMLLSSAVMSYKLAAVNSFASRD